MGRSSSENHKRNLQLFHRKSKFLLNDIERDFLHDMLKQYETYKDVKKLMVHLLDILDTTAKLDLLVEIRGLIPKMHLAKFDWLAPYAKMAHPVILTSGHHATGTSGSGKYLRKSRSENSTVGGSNGYHDNPSTAVRMVTIDKDTDALGFAIRGGSENGQGISISSVEPGSLEESVGLGIGDKILEVNNISFDNITLSSAQMVLQGNSRLRLKVQHSNSIVGHRMAKEKTTWFDTVRRKMVAGDFNDVDPSHAAMGGTRLLSRGDERRIIITLSSQRCIGFNIRGGMEYGVGIYVSKVDKGGLAEAHGITIGDQIIDVNGVTTESVTHAQAVELIRNQPCLIMTIRSVNRYPAYKELCSDSPGMDRGTTSKRRHSASPTSGTTPLTHNELIDAIPVEVAERYTQTHAHNESNDWPKHQSITMSPTPIPKSSRSSVATETSSLLQKHMELSSNNVTTPVKHHDEPQEQMTNLFQADAPIPRDRTASVLGRSHSMKIPGEKALPTLEPEAQRNESRRVKRNRTFREVLFGMKMKSKEKKDQKNKKPTSDQKRIKKRYPSAAYASLNKKPSIEHPHHTENTDQSEPSTVAWAMRKPVQTEASANSNPGSIARRSRPNPPSLLQAANTEQQLGTDPETLHQQQYAAFTHGAGTQLMYSDARYASAMSVLEDMAKKLLKQDECDAITRHVKVYHKEGRIENLVSPLLVILDKPEKILLLREVRGVIAPSDLGRFDSMVSRKELQAYDQLQFGRKDPSQPMHSLRRNSIDKPRRTILEPKQDQEGKFVLHTQADVKQNKRRQQELDNLRKESQLKVSALRTDDDPASDTNSLNNSDIQMSLFDNPGKNNFREDEPRSSSAESNWSRGILNTLPEEPQSSPGLESEAVFAGLHKKSSPDSKMGKTDMADSKSDSTSENQYSGDEINRRKQWLDPDYIPGDYISEHQTDKKGPKWVLPTIEDAFLEDAPKTSSQNRKSYGHECSDDDSDDVALPTFEDDSTNSDTGSNLEDDSMKPNKSGLYSLIQTNSCQEGVHPNSTSPAWSSPNPNSPVSDMSLPPTPVTPVDTPTVPKTPPNTELSPTLQTTTATPEIILAKDEPIYAKVDMSKKRSRQPLKTSLSVDGSVDSSMDSSDSGRRSPYKVTFTEYRGSPVPSRKGILKNSFCLDEAPQFEKRRFSSDYLDIDDINLGDPAPLQEIDAEARMRKASSSASSADEATMEQLQAGMETMHKASSSASSADEAVMEQLQAGMETMHKASSSASSVDEAVMEQLEAGMETMTVTLNKSRASLGISVSGGRDSKNQPEVRIDRIFPGGAASDDGILQAGSEVISADGKSLKGVTHPQAVDMIRRAYHDKTRKTIEFVVKQLLEDDTHL